MDFTEHNEINKVLSIEMRDIISLRQACCVCSINGIHNKSIQACYVDILHSGINLTSGENM